MCNQIKVGDTVKVRACDLPADRYYTVDDIKVSSLDGSTRFVVSGIALSRSGIVPVGGKKDDNK